MINLDFVRENLAVAQKGLEARGFDGKLLKELLSLDKKRKETLIKVEDLRAIRNIAAKERDVKVGKLTKVKLEKEEEALQKIENELKSKLYALPNLPLPEVPAGAPDKKKVIDKGSSPAKSSFKAKDHLEIGERLGIIDVQTAAKVSGSRFAYFKGEGALLELALLNFAFERLTKENFQPVMPPVLIKKDITDKLGYWHGGGNENYYLVREEKKERDEDSLELYLIGTAEHAIVPMNQDKIIPVEELPQRYVAFSPSFRREAGSYGKDVRGVLRVHQFDKIEMVSFAHPDQAEEEFEKILDLSWDMMQELGLPARKVILSSQDMSFPAAKTVDIETWFPSQNDYRETHSISTTTTYQSARFNTKFMGQGKSNFVHILNGTAFAIGRTIAAILENYQREDGTVEIPKALRPYTGFDEIGLD